MKKRPRILVDCDGILADFVASALKLINDHTGEDHTHDEIVQWDVFKALGKKDIEHILDNAVANGGFCAALEVLPGSVSAIEKLRRRGDVFIVTSPYDAPNWVYERTRWLERHFGFHKKQIVNTSSKFVVSGDVLVDDSDKNLQEWLDHHSQGLALLWDRPWNRQATPDGVHRVNDWDTLIQRVDTHLGK